MAHIGNKYDSSRDVTDVAKLVRKDIKAAIKSGLLPKGFKASVVCDKYSMGCSLNLHVKSCPGLEIFNRVWLAEDENTRDWGNALNPAAAEVIGLLERMVNAYNRDDIDSMTDYYSVAFYGYVQFDRDFRDESRAASLAAMAEAAEVASSGEIAEVYGLDGQRHPQADRAEVVGSPAPFAQQAAIEANRANAPDESCDGYRESRERGEADAHAIAQLASMDMTGAAIH